MDNRIRLTNLSDIYAAGIQNFAESLLKAKAEKGQSVVYSVDGQIITLKAGDALWIYNKLTKGLKDWEVEFLSQRAAEGKDMEYWLEGGQTLVIPAKLVLDLLNLISE